MNSESETVDLKLAIQNLIDNHNIKSIKEFDDISHEALIRKSLDSGKTARKVAKDLGIGKTTLYRKIKEYGIRKST